MKKGSYGIVLVLMMLFFALASFAGDGELVILHTNDIHGAFLPQPASWVEGRPLIGGFEPLSGAISSERAIDQPILLLDAGDFMTGNPISDLEINGVVGGAMLEFFELMKYDAITVGNHEFDVGTVGALKLVTASKIPIISANLWHISIEGEKSQKPIPKLFAGEGWKVFDVGSMRVGVIGLVMEDLAGSISKDARASVWITPCKEEVQKAVGVIDPISDLIVLLTHQGLEEDRELATDISGVDVIVGGHSHTPIETPQMVNNIIIVQAGAYCRYLGRLWLRVENDEVAEYNGKLIPLWADSLQATPEAKAFVGKYQEILNREFGKTIATLDEDWKRANYEESALGSWLADRLRDFGQGDFAAVNSGGIRKDLLKGQITTMDIKEMLPFSNRVVSFQCTGKQLMTLVKTNASAGLSRKSEILQVSGLTYKINQSSGEPTQILINGNALDLKKKYLGISIDYVAVSQAERYFGFVPDKTEDLGISFTEMVGQYIIEHGIKEKPPGGRIILIENR